MAGDVVTLGSEDALLRDDVSHGARSTSHHHPKNHGGHVAGHQHTGRVTAINESHSNPKHATIEITHGKKKRDKESGDLNSYNQARSSITVPKAAAKNYTMGQRVNAGIAPCDDGDHDDMDGGTDDAPPAKSAAKKGATKGAKSAKPAAKAASKPASPIAQALVPPRRKR